MAKYLIINADDFGPNKEQNEAIKYLLKKELITSTSLMSVASQANDATDFASKIRFSPKTELLQALFFNGAGFFKRLLLWVLSGRHTGLPLQNMRYIHL